MSESPHGIEERPNRSRERLMLLAGVLALCVLLAGFQWRALGARAETHATLAVRLDQMRHDAERINALRDAPRSALSRSRPSDELLAQVEKALAAAGIDRGAWRDSVPAPAVPVPGSDYRRLTTRLYFEQVGLKQLASFAEALESADATLSVSAVNLRAREESSQLYDADVGVAYLLYAPKGK